MRMIIKARLKDNSGGSVKPFRLAEFERSDGELKLLGLCLAEGRTLVTKVQCPLVAALVERNNGAGPSGGTTASAVTAPAQPAPRDWRFAESKVNVSAFNGFQLKLKETAEYRN